MSVILLFIDGVGLGTSKPANPFVKSNYRGFSAMLGNKPFISESEGFYKTNHLFKTIDATLGIEGLPQSGTGQATLFSGVNAAKEIGKHFGTYPHSGIRHLLDKKSLFQKAQRLDKSCYFINAYPNAFFEYAKKRNRWSCTTLMTRKAGIPLNRVEDIRQGRALTAELTQEAWRDQLNINIPTIQPEKAANILIKQSDKYDLILSEYYLSDKAGHSQDLADAEKVLGVYDRFLAKLINNKPTDTTIILSSDHGNVEDLSTKTHTLNNVPLFSMGPASEYFRKVESIMGVTPAII